MKNLLKLFGIIALTAIIGFSFVTCDNGGDDDGDGDGGGDKDGSKGGGNSEYWRSSKSKMYSVRDGVTSLLADSVINYSIDRYTSDTNSEQKYTLTQTIYGETTTTSSITRHTTRNGQTSVFITDEINNGITTTTTTIDSASGLSLKTIQSGTDNLGAAYEYETSYAVEPLSDSGGVKTYKYYMISSTHPGQVVSAQGYYEYKIQNGITLEVKNYNRTTNELQVTTTYTLPDNAVIRAKLPYYTTVNSVFHQASYNSYYTTVELISDSATELVIRSKQFQGVNNANYTYTDTTYEKVNRSK